MKCVQIEVDDDGNFTVGLKPYDQAPDDGAATDTTTADAGAGAGAGAGGMAEEGAEVEGAQGEEDAEQSYMQPARDLNDALTQAKTLLTQPDTADGGPSPFESGFAGIRGGAPTPGA